MDPMWRREKGQKI